MGFFDSIKKSWKTLRTAIKTLLDLNHKYEALVARIKQGASLPHRNPTRSYWLEDPPFPELVDIRSKSLPNQADVVIIGSGITGAAVARSLLRESKRKDQDLTITVLEARDICSGATGRNGGHIKASPHETFAKLEAKYGVKRAVALTRFQLNHLDCLTDLCQSEEFTQAECRKVETVDLFFDQKTFDDVCHTASKLKTLLPEHQGRVYQAVEAQKVIPCFHSLSLAVMKLTRDRNLQSATKSLVHIRTRQELCGRIGSLLQSGVSSWMSILTKSLSKLIRLCSGSTKVAIKTLITSTQIEAS